MDFALLKIIRVLADYDMETNIYNYASANGIEWHTFYTTLKKLEAKGWLAMIKNPYDNTITLIVKDPLILCNNLATLLDIMYNKGVVEASKYVDRVNNDFKEVLKDENLSKS